MQQWDRLQYNIHQIARLPTCRSNSTISEREVKCGAVPLSRGLCSFFPSSFLSGLIILWVLFILFNLLFLVMLFNVHPWYSLSCWCCSSCRRCSCWCSSSCQSYSIIHADGLLHPADVLLFADAAAATGGQSTRNCPNGWVDGTYVGMGNTYISRENLLSNKIHKRYKEVMLELYRKRC